MIRAYFWPFALALSISAASSVSQLAAPDLGLTLAPDKLAHFLIFGLLATSVLRIPSFCNQGLRGAAAAALVVSCFGAIDEFRQSMTPDRAVELMDWIADTAGAIVAVISYTYWPRYRNILEWKPRPRPKTESSSTTPSTSEEGGANI